MGAVFLYAGDSARNRIPPKLELLWLIERFGWDAAHKAPLGEMRQLIAADNIYSAFKSREAYRDRDGDHNWAEWAANNRALDRILQAAMLAAEAIEDDGNS